MSSLPSFEECFSAVHGHGPYPWQSRLATQVLAEDWPDLLDLPTGTGKTSALDVALYALAAAPDRMPRRIVLVVDRRIVVDQGAKHARKILDAMRAAKTGPLVALAARLRNLCGEGNREVDPFAIAVLRGGAPRDDDWAKRPDQAVLGVSTVDQVGSRLLFRGYGVSPKLASIHAGLMGNDTLILLDEVHLAVPFAQTLRTLEEQYLKSHCGLPKRFKVVEMSATPDSEDAPRRRFGLDAADHVKLQQVLRARKPAQLIEVAVRGSEPACRKKIAEEAAGAAKKLRAQGANAIGVVVNRVDTAHRVFTELSEAKLGEVVLVTGRMRPLDRDRVVEGKLLPLSGAGRDRSKTAPVFVVATQCIEAGADLDFDGMVTELASLDALKQRFGRLDRRGERTTRLGDAPAVVLARSDALKEGADDPIYGTSLQPTWSFLQGVAQEGIVDMGIEGLSDKVSSSVQIADLLAPRPNAPILLPGHVDAWAQTSPLLRPDPDPDISLWLHGPDRGQAEVQIVWRADLLAEDIERFSAGAEASERREAVEESLSLVRPSPLEALSLPVWAARQWLSQSDSSSDLSDVMASRPPEENRDPSDVVIGLVLRKEGWQAVTIAAMRPGDLVIVPAKRGGIGESKSFDPDSATPVADLGDLAQLRGRGIVTVRTAPECLSWLGELDAPPGPDPEASRREERDNLRAWAESWPETAPEGFAGRPEEYERARKTLRALKLQPSVVSFDGERSSFVVAQKLQNKDREPEMVTEAYSEDDQSSFTSVDASLASHSADVYGKAKEFVASLGLPQTVSNDVMLAGWLHDVGKADPRFQLVLAGGDEVAAAASGQPQAKSALPKMAMARRRAIWKRSGLPDGFRHELLSLGMIEANEVVATMAHDLDLVLHLVASHHGWCRPFAPAVAADPAQPVNAVLLEHQVPGSGAADHPSTADAIAPYATLSLNGNPANLYGALDSGCAERFWRLNERYGAWGLAWLEAILRLADHRASEDLETKGRS